MPAGPIGFPLFGTLLAALGHTSRADPAAAGRALTEETECVLSKVLVPRDDMPEQAVAHQRGEPIVDIIAQQSAFYVCNVLQYTLMLSAMGVAIRIREQPHQGLFDGEMEFHEVPSAQHQGMYFMPTRFVFRYFLVQRDDLDDFLVLMVDIVNACRKFCLPFHALLVHF
jgi:hypothetical protein